MTAEQLKNSILQMAVQGKLVPQDPNDEPASELIKRIREEKEKLIKEGKIKKEKNPSYIFRGEDNIPYEKIGKNEPVSIADEVPFEIPESWEWVRLGTLVYNHGQKKPESTFSYIDIGSIDNANQKLSSNENLIEADKAPSRARKIVETGDIIYSTVRPYLHNMCIINKDFSFEPIASTGFAVMTSHADFVNEFLFLYMMSPDFDAYANDTDNSKGVAYPAINDERLYKAFIPVPPVSEQKRIIEKYTSLKPYINKYGNTEEKLTSLNGSFPEQLKKSILQEAVMGKLVPQDKNDEPASVLLERIREEKQRLIAEGKLKKDKHESIIYRRDNSHYEKLDGVERCIDDEIPFEIPDSWSWCRIKDIFETSSGTTPSKSNSSYYDLPKYNWVRTTDLNNDVLTTCEMKISKKAFEECRLEVLPYDSVCIAMYGGAGTIGKNALIRFETTINQSVCAIHPNGFINMEYVQLYIKYLRPEWMRYASGSRKDPNINQVIIKNMLIPIPPINEQIRIVISAQRVMDSCEKI